MVIEDQLNNKKIKPAQRAGFSVLVCVGWRFQALTSSKIVISGRIPIRPGYPK